MSDIGAAKFQASLSCGMSIEAVIEAAEEFGGEFGQGSGDLDFKSVTFENEHGFNLIISTEHGLLYGASTHVNTNSGGEFLCCMGVPQCEGNEAST